jgi:ABC-type oligopeptide transport system ATPase subunit
MTIEKIKFLVGMPGSGKSTLGNSISDGATLFIDDISIITKNAKEYLSNLNVDGYSQLIIADVFFCQESVRNAATKIVQEVFPNIPIEYLFFENSAEKCLINVEKRKENGDDRKVEELIKILSKQYVIPEGSQVVEIKHQTSNKPKI